MRPLFWLWMSLVALSESTSISADHSYWYDWGVYGAYPQRTYESFGAASPWTNILKYDSRCDDGHVFIGPRGLSVPTPGPIILDKKGDLVWMETKWGQAMDLKVQSYQGNDYITFWTGTDNGTFGEGHYLMLDSSYEIFKIVKPADNLTGDLHEFRITDTGTALMTIYERRAADLTVYGIPQGWIYDSLFQEIDLATGDLLFQWRASDHYAINESRAPIRSFGREPTNGFDFFHINSIDKDNAGNYLISSRYMCALTYINQKGEIIWQLGGDKNNFTDLSGGAATNFTWQHHASWYENNSLTIFDNGAYDKLHTAEYSRGLLVGLDYANMTATLVKDYVAPQHLLVPSQGSMQMLQDTGNVLVGWGHTPAYTEFSADGEVLCDVHIGAVSISFLGWCKNYRTFKSQWTGRPKTVPSVAMRPKEGILYVSWNGATDVEHWVLQSGAGQDDEAFVDIIAVTKESFETEILVPDEVQEYLRVAAVDQSGNVLAYSKPVSKRVETKTPPMTAPSQGSRISIFQLLVTTCALVFVIILFLFFRSAILRGFNRVVRRAVPYKYQELPTS